jgi:aminoglycoside phosphotransferase (APT) family kinase protein
VHLDLHPANVVLTASGPAVIDWPNAGRGDGLADVATTWVILRTSRVEGPAALGLVAARLADRNVRDHERRLLRRLVSPRPGGGPGPAGGRGEGAR